MDLEYLTETVRACQQQLAFSMKTKTPPTLYLHIIGIPFFDFLFLARLIRIVNYQNTIDVP